MIRIGVTGHRILDEVDKIEAGVEEALCRIEEAFPGEPLTIISALAEGADRIVARLVLERLGARLIAPLPLAKPDYITDFKTPESQAEFLSLLERAEQVIEMDPVATRDQAYENVGDYVLQHSEVLIAVWDGRDAQGKGGTGAIVARARERGLAIAWVHAGNREPQSHQPTSLGLSQGTVSFEGFVNSLSFDEFKLYYESAEKVTERRLSANTWNYSLCVAIVVAIALTINWSVSHRPFFYVGLVGVIILCAMAILFCSLWMGQIDDFKLLNDAKFKVLNQMARHIEFDPSLPGQAKSFRPFEKEWQILKEVKAAVAIPQHKIIALKSSSIEYFIPKAFRIIFLAITIACLVAIAFNWVAFITSWKALIQAANSSAIQ